MKHLEKVFLIMLLVGITVTFAIGEQDQRPLDEVPDHHGKNFLIGFLEMSTPLGHSNIYITSKKYGAVRVFAPFLNLTLERTVMPGVSTKIQLPSTVRMKGFNKEKKGILISSNVTISVYATNARENSRDVHVVFPTPSLGTEHIAVCFTPRDKSLIGIVALTDNTLVQIRFKLQRNDNISYEGKTYCSGDVLQVFLNKLESFQVQHRKDLTGTVVISNQAVAVLSGNVCASVPSKGETCSHLAAQIPSLSKWGKSFITTPVAHRNIGDVFRVVSAYNKTLVSIGEGQNFTLDAGEFRQFELKSNENRSIICSKPSMLVQFNKDSRGNVYSEPFTLIIPPTEQYGFSYDLVIPVKKAPPAFENYISLVAETSQIQDLLFNASFLISGNFTWNFISGTKYSLGLSEIQWPWTHSTSISIKRTSGDVRFTAFAVGHTDSDGYGYVGGMALKDINCERLFPAAMKLGDRIDNDCDGRTDEERNNGLDDDGDGAIDEDLEYVVYDCSVTPVLDEDNTETSVYLNGANFSYSISQGDCESLVKMAWYIPSPIGPTVTLVRRHIKTVKPSVSVSFPPNAYVGRENISTLEDLKPKLSSLCPVDDINVTFTDSRSTNGNNVTLITRQWVVRDKCGRTVYGNQTIIELLLIRENTKSLRSQSNHALVLGLGIGLGTAGLFAAAVSMAIIWKKHVSGSVNISARIDVLEAIDQEWHYTNTMAIEEEYAEISKGNSTKEQKVYSLKSEHAPSKVNE